jgi:hypothetical protein
VWKINAKGVIKDKKRKCEMEEKERIKKGRKGEKEKRRK